MTTTKLLYCLSCGKLTRHEKQKVEMVQYDQRKGTKQSIVIDVYCCPCGRVAGT